MLMLFLCLCTTSVTGLGWTGERVQGAQKWQTMRHQGDRSEKRRRLWQARPRPSPRGGDHQSPKAP